MSINLTDNLTLNTKKTKSNRNYTKNEEAVMKDIRRAAQKLHWVDIYSGETFTNNKYKPSIEHLIPYSSRDTLAVKEKISKGFKLNGLDNIFPVSKMENEKRSSEDFSEVLIKEPKVLDRLLVELDKYKNYKSELVDGNQWHKRLYKTVVESLTGLCSDVKTKALFTSK